MPLKSVSGSSFKTSTTIFLVARIQRRVAHVQCTQRVHSIVQCSVAYRSAMLSTTTTRFVHHSMTFSLFLKDFEQDASRSARKNWFFPFSRAKSVLIKNLLSHRRCGPRSCLISYLCSSALWRRSVEERERAWPSTANNLSDPNDYILMAFFYSVSAFAVGMQEPNLMKMMEFMTLDTWFSVHTIFISSTNAQRQFSTQFIHLW